VFHTVRENEGYGGYSALHATWRQLYENRADWQRHYRILADLVDTDGHLPDIAPGVTFDGDDIGRWLQRQAQPTAWAQLSSEQQERLSKLGLKPVEAPPPAPTAQALGEGSEQGAAGLPARPGGPRAVGREGGPAVGPRGHSEEVAVDGEAEPVVVKLGVWVSNTKSRRDKLTQDQLDALRELGVEWA
jgi:hypothetical protein